MKNFQSRKAAVAFLAVLLASAATPAAAATKCATSDDLEICHNSDSGSYSVRRVDNPAIWINGKCGEGGGATWRSLPFPLAEEIHSIYCPGHSLRPVSY